MKKLLYFLLLLLSFTQTASGEEEMLPPDEAFKFKAEVVTPDKVRASWEVADGYYLYRERFKFDTETKKLSLDSPIYPQGNNTDDPAFGKMEVYREEVAIDIPIKRGETAEQAIELALKVKYQGCADAGLCYPPQTKTADLKLAAVENKQEPAKPNKPQALLSDLISKKSSSSADGEPLPVEEAFVFNITAIDKGTLKALWTVQPGHHLYRPKFKFTVTNPQGVSLGTPVFPQGKQVEDEYFGKIEVYGEDIEVTIPILQSDGLNKIQVKTEYQGCSDNTGICYPPVSAVNDLELEGLPPAPERSAQETDNTNTASSAPMSEQDMISKQLETQGYLQNLLFFLLAGLGLALTPCVFPMIPILSGIIAGSSSNNNTLSTRRAFLLSIAYVLPMAVTYAIVGVIAGLSGANLNIMFQNPWVISAFSGLFILLALSMFGFYDLQMPASIQSRLTEISNRQQGGSVLGAGIMGVLSALIVGPCVTAPLIGALIYIADSRDAVLGGLSLFSLGIGMGIPLLALGIGAGHMLPRAGAWMDTTKAIFGIMMLGLAIWMLDRVVPAEVTMALTGILLVSSGIHMGALETTNDAAGGWGRFWKSLGLLMLFYGGMILFGVAAGSNNLLQPLKGVFGGGNAYAVSATATQQAPQHLQFQQIKGLKGLEEALAQAKAKNQAVMLDFYADWCVSCKELEHITFQDPSVVSSLQSTLLIQADVTANDEQDKALNQHFNVYGPPQILFFKPDGKEIKEARLAGFEDPENFLKRIQLFQSRLK